MEENFEALLEMYMNEEEINEKIKSDNEEIKEEEQNNQVDRSSTYSEERRHNSKENTDQYTNNCTVDFIGLDFCLINGIDQSSKCNDQKA